MPTYVCQMAIFQIEQEKEEKKTEDILLTWNYLKSHFFPLNFIHIF